jgi:hypothetical protein
MGCGFDRLIARRLTMNQTTAITRTLGTDGLNTARLPVDRPDTTAHSGRDTTGNGNVFHRVVTTVGEDCRERISAFDMDGEEICGAFNPAGQPYWLVYVTNTATTAAGYPRQYLFPRHLQLRSRQHARQWLELIAGLYVRAAFQ